MSDEQSKKMETTEEPKADDVEAHSFKGYKGYKGAAPSDSETETNDVEAHSFKGYKGYKGYKG